MPANIAMNGTAFIARGSRNDIWHDMGETFEDSEDLNVSEAAERVKINEIIVDVSPVVAVWENPATGQAEMVNTDSAVLLRRPTSADPQLRLFGKPVNRDYQPIQVSDLTAMLDPVVADGWRLSTMGALGEGETVFVCFEGEKFAVAKRDEVTRFFTVANWNTGTRAASAFVTPIRTVCQNTLMAGLSAAELQVKVPHAQNAKRDLDTYVRLITGIKEAQEAIIAQFDRLATIHPFADEERDWVTEIVNAAFPIKATKPQAVRLRDALVGDQSLLLGTDPTVGVTNDDLGADYAKAKMVEFQRMQAQADTAEARYEREKERAMSLRAGAIKLYEMERGDTSSPAHDLGTAWLAANAVAELVQFQRSTRADAQAELDDIAFGERQRVVRRAFSKAGELVASR